MNGDPAFEQLMLDRAGREFLVCATWMGEVSDEVDTAIRLATCLGDDYVSLFPGASENYRALKPRSAQERWEGTHKRRPPPLCFECEVTCAWCNERVAVIDRSETRANRRDLAAEAVAAAIVREHLWSCTRIQKRLEESDAPVGRHAARLAGRGAGRRGPD